MKREQLKEAIRPIVKEVLNEEKPKFKKNGLTVGKIRIAIYEDDKSVNFYNNNRFALDMPIKSFEKIVDWWIKNKG